MKTTRIDFVDNVSTKEAGMYTLKYGWAFAKGACGREHICTQAAVGMRSSGADSERGCRFGTCSRGKNGERPCEQGDV